MYQISEPDWKRWRKIKEPALNRLCQRILDSLAKECADASKSPHERYLSIFQMIREQDKDIAMGFDDLRRSNALDKIALVHSMGLIEPGELATFSQELRDFLQQFTRSSE